MDHRAFVSALPPEVKTQLTTPSNRAGLLHLLGHGGAIVLLGALIIARIPGWPFLIFPQGVLVIFLFTLEHEATHKTPFASVNLNEWVGRVCGVLLLLPFEWFRYFHLAHHRWTNIAGRDPELDGPKPQTRRAWALHVSGLPYWSAAIRLIYHLARGQADAPYLPETAKPRMIRETRILAAIYAAVALSLLITPVLFWVWLLPVVLGQPILRLYLLAEHGDCPQVVNMFENTRTTFTTGLVRFLAWNMPYHTEHHVYPAVPFHLLPTLHRLMKDELQVTANGYSTFTKTYLARRP